MVQEMFNKEFGVSVGYNSKTNMLSMRVAMILMSLNQKAQQIVWLMLLKITIRVKMPINKEQ